MTDDILQLKEEIIECLRKRGIPAKELQQVEEAYALAEKAHKGAFRKSGEPYIVHPVSVAWIIAVTYQLGTAPVMAAFLHDVVEDTHYTLQDIQHLFGDEVAYLVEVVTKPQNRVANLKQVDNFKQLLESLNFDIRAVLIKIADRTHNMQTLSSMSLVKQMKIAGETDYFYAPLAMRLGLYEVKTELENLSFRYRCPSIYQEIEEQRREYVRFKQKEMENIIKEIHQQLEATKWPVKIELKVRTVFSIWKKMKKSGRDFDHIRNKSFLRIIFEKCPEEQELSNCLDIYERLTKYRKDKPGKFSNYIINPKDNSYQSLHFSLMMETGKWEELHVESERMKLNSELGCLRERGKNVKEWLERFRLVLKDLSNNEREKITLSDLKKDLYNNSILVFARNGAQRLLPRNATAIDFAFAISISLGHKAKYAIINDAYCSLKTRLNNGDRITICEDDNLPQLKNREEYAETSLAINELRKVNGQKTYVLCPYCEPIKGEELVGFKMDNHLVEIHKRNCVYAISKAAEKGDSIIEVEYLDHQNNLYPVTIEVVSIDRFHLYIDVLKAISDDCHLDVKGINISSEDNIVRGTITFLVHNYTEKINTIKYIKAIDSVQEVILIKNTINK